MSLAEYRVHDGVDVALVDPFAARLLELLERFAGRVLIISGRRSFSEQMVLWNRYVAGGTLAARPGTSKHERGQAADLRIVDTQVSWTQVHAVARTVGVWFPVRGEDWHAEADPDFVEQEVADVRRIIATVNGANAQFWLVGVGRLDDGTFVAVQGRWLADQAQVDYYRAGRTDGVIRLEAADLKGVPLVGPVPHGDVREWTADDFLSVA